MKKLLTILLVLIMCCGLCACGVTSITNEVTSIDLNLSNATLSRGEEGFLRAIVYPENAVNAEIVWTSSDDSIVSVDDSGKIKGISVGTATVTARTDNGISASCYITVEEPVEKINRNDVFSAKPEYLTFSMNSAGGIEFNWKHNYIGNKKINYIQVTYSLYDAVGNLTKDDHKRETTHTMRLIGPFNVGEPIEFNSDVIVYCDVCAKVSFDSIVFEYADGTFAEFQYGWQNTVK